MRHVAMAVALFGAALWAANGLTAEEPKKDEKTVMKDITKLMKETHRGEKSPHVRVEAELKKDSPDWDQVAKDAKAFDEMGKAFKSLGIYYPYASPAGYVKNASALGKAAGEKDKKAATEAFTGLTKSCVACHSYGGPGGTLSK
jgi:hypothetical protein